MLNAELIGLSGQVALQREMDVVANNIANINTSGYKSQTVLFEEYLMPVAEATAFKTSDQTLRYVQDWATYRDVEQGRILPTGNPLDVAIEGEGYLVVQTPNGERYTRNGALKINSIGELVTNEGYKILGTGGQIAIGNDDIDLTIASDGTISSTNGQIGKLRIVSFANEQALKREGSSLYSGDNPTEITTPRIAQGLLEKSNVEPVHEIARMIEITRSYEMQSRMIADAANLRRTAIERLGTLQA